MALDTGGGCPGGWGGFLKLCVLFVVLVDVAVGRWEQGYKPPRFVPVSSLPPYQTNR